jgi:hypothetical protein
MSLCLLAVTIGNNNCEKEQEMAAHACCPLVTCASCVLIAKDVKTS